MDTPQKTYDKIMSDCYRFFKNFLLLASQDKIIVQYHTGYTINQVILEKTETTMKRGNFNTTFVNYKLTEKDKATFATWLPTVAERLAALIEQIVLDGYKVTISSDTEQTAFFVTLTCKDDSSPNANCAMTSRHFHLEDALLVAAFKQLVIFDNVPWESLDKGADWG